MSRLKWWQSAVFYQIYPRSFADSDEDGIGDFRGITSRLDYLRDLGIDAVWLSPHYPSPFLDCGYDISDFNAVAPEYGTLRNFIDFLHEAHARDIRVILDLVLNHTSDLHPWFAESRGDRHNPRRDWYIWRDGRDGGPPNNWVSIFGGPAWELDPQTGQYYYHAFLKEQPDLNWRNPQVKKAMWDTVRFWLELGVDGFRLDAIASIFEHPELPDHDFPLTLEEIVRAGGLTLEDHRRLLRYQFRQPGVHELMQDLRALVEQYPGERVLVGEDDDIAFYGAGDNELQLVFNFPLMHAERLTPENIRANQEERLSSLPPGAWPCNTLGNHDTPRVWSRFGDGEHDAELARLHLALLLTLKGTPFLYNGEEIGMSDLQLNSLSELRDTAAVNLYRRLTEEAGMPAEDALRIALAATRDRCRSPMQWSDAPHAGFCPPEVAPWLPVNPSYASGVNVAAQAGDSNSLLNFYRRLLHLRRRTPALVAGDYQALLPESEHFLAFLRRYQAGNQDVLVALNFSPEPQRAVLKLSGAHGRLLFSSHERPAGELPLSGLTLEPFECLIAALL